MLSAARASPDRPTARRRISSRTSPGTAASPSSAICVRKNGLPPVVAWSRAATSRDRRLAVERRQVGLDVLDPEAGERLSLRHARELGEVAGELAAPALHLPVGAQDQDPL